MTRGIKARNDFVDGRNQSLLQVDGRELLDILRHFDEQLPYKFTE